MLEHWPQGLQIGFPNPMVSFSFSALGPIQGHKVQHLLIAWGRLIFFCSNSAFTPSGKLSGPISTLASIGMLDLG
jgi:hypothetical protein